MEVATFAGTISDTGGSSSNNGGRLVMSGSGAQVLAGSNSFTGGTTVQSGRLTVDGSLASPVNVSGGTLAGTGYLSSVTVDAGGTLAPGDSLGVLHLSGNLALLAGAEMDFELDGVSTDDEVSMPSGVLSLSNQQFSNFTFTPMAGFGPGTYDLIAFASSSGSLGTNRSGTIDGLQATLAVQGNDLVLNVTPEPSTFVLLYVGAIGLAGWAWRRRVARTEKLTAFDQVEPQDDGPAILGMPSRWTEAARRAA